MSNNSYPGGSKSRVNHAGDRIRSKTASPEDYRVLDEWRASHRSVLNTFQAILRTRTKSTQITVAQRHKRRITIFDKLSRQPKMQLARMDDVAGCRLIFPAIEDLHEFRAKFHKAKFKHRMRNAPDKYDYISRPKSTGYRGIHDVYEYDVNSEEGRSLAGLYIEIQYRTLVQHAWATAVEVIGSITESQPKFQQGDNRYETAMAYASELLARAFENRTGPLPDLEDADVVEKFEALDKELNLLQKLRGLNATNDPASANKNKILILSKDGSLEVRSYRDAPEALKALYQLEAEFPDLDIVLVRAFRSEDVRLAFRNYFSDARDFVSMVGEAARELGPKS